MSPKYWSVAVNAPLMEALTYLDNKDIEGIKPGVFVEVPLGKRRATGLVLRDSAAPSEFVAKPIAAVLPESFEVDEGYLRWIEWIAQYYFFPVGQVASLILPPLLKKGTRKKKNLFESVPKGVAEPLRLTEEQENCIKAIQQHVGFKTHLLFGVTGSGKTEVYLNLFSKTLEQGRSGLFLVPEISLTPQLVRRFVQRFGDNVGVIHSHLTDRERTDQWWDMVEEKKKILIGARSALFCPLKNLGLIVLDEEHEPSFKQEERLKYHARDAAIRLGQIRGCPVVLGSATPSLESWNNVKEGKFEIHRMSSRVESRKMPNVEIVDLKDVKKTDDLPFWLSQNLHDGIVSSLQKREQVALFLNRRGVANIVLCPLCGKTEGCPNCDISLTLHSRTHLICHYCDFHKPLPEACSTCREGQLTPLGLGTEKVEEDIRRSFPQARVARADRDEITSREDLESLISNMENGEIDILIGTQMIAKGLDFARLNLVGLVLADVGFNLPDFRASERSFQLLVQVSGRSGRHLAADQDPGKVIVQTYNPEHPSLQYAQFTDYEGFAGYELQNRKELGYPPTGRLVSIRLQSQKLGAVEEACHRLLHRAELLKTKDPRFQELELLGPTQAALAKLRGYFRFHMLIKAKNVTVLHLFLKRLSYKTDWLPSGVRWMLDVDPIHLL